MLILGCTRSFFLFPSFLISCMSMGEVRASISIESGNRSCMRLRKAHLRLGPTRETARSHVAALDHRWPSLK